VTELTFLGTGGGRFTTISQLRQTGGLYIRDRGLNCNIDPGPGALVHMHRYGLDPTKTDSILVSHGHLDHCTDAPVLLEGITRGGLDKKGTLVAPPSAFKHTKQRDGRGVGPIFAPHHRQMAANAHEVRPGDKLSLNGMYDLEATRQFHSDPETVGFKMKLTHGQFSYIIDTQYHDDLWRQHQGSRVVVCQMTRGGDSRIPWHMCTEDVKILAEKIRPKLMLLTHFGYKTLKDGDPGVWAQQITDETGVATVAGRDGLRVTMNQDIEMELMGKARTPA
jgi:ribonuclease BN (tRNA processing enzyme)